MFSIWFTILAWKICRLNKVPITFLDLHQKSVIGYTDHFLTNVEAYEKCEE